MHNDNIYDPEHLGTTYMYVQVRDLQVYIYFLIVQEHWYKNLEQTKPSV